MPKKIFFLKKIKAICLRKIKSQKSKAKITNQKFKIKAENAKYDILICRN